MAHTLLLGLGGTGSRVVAKVAKELETNNIAINDGVVCCAVMDTDKNDLDRLLKTVGVKASIPTVPTSSAQTVGDVLRKHPEATEWCIDDVDVFKGETMTNGASTMRMKSRLAFLDTYGGMKIKSIEELVSQMMTTGDGNDDIRVMLVSSISGGTGAGMFVQTALWIRNLFKERGREIKLRGMLILPDVFVKTIKDVQNNDFLEERHYANAYAAIREMNAISKIKLEPGYKPNVPMKIDDLFDSEDLDNPRRSPKGLFDFIFFIDYENKSGANLRSISAYEDIIGQLSYTQLYSPMSDTINTKEDNIFLAHIRQGFSFGSCGMAKAVYPKDDVMEYCILRTISQMIGKGWCNLDAQIESVRMEEMARKKAGETVVSTDPVKKYVELYEEKLNTKDPFFSALKEEASAVKVSNFMTDLEQIVKSKVDGLNKNRKGLSKLDALGENLEKTVKNPAEDQNENPTATKFEVQTVAAPAQEEKESLEKDLEKYDVAALKAIIPNNNTNFKMEIDSFNKTKLNEVFNSVINSVFPRIKSELEMSNTKSVYGMLTSKDEMTGQINFVHPVAMRYLLYKLQEAIAGAKKDNDDELKKAVNKLKRLEMEVKFDYKKTKNVETLENYFEKSASFFQGGEKAYRKYFIDQYRIYIKKQYGYGKEYEIKSVNTLVLQELYNRVTKLIKNLEDFFKKITVITKECEEKMATNLSKSLQSTNVTYVCASEKAKEYVYNSLDMSMDGSDKETNKLIIDSVYGMVCAEAIPTHTDNKPYANFDIVKAFTEGVRRFYTEKIMSTKRDKIDMDIYTALKSEMLSEGETHADSAMGKLIATLEHNAEPYLQYVDEEQEQITYAFWGFHPSLSAAYPNLGACIGGNAQTQANDTFPSNEIICYRTVYNVDVPHFLKFSEDMKSDYYKEYSEIVNKMDDTKGQTLMQTPHLDKTWHNVLPYLTDEKQAAEDSRLYRGILLGFAYNRLRIDDEGIFQILRGESEWTRFCEGDDLVRKYEVSDFLRMLMKDGLFIYKDIKLLEDEFKEETRELKKYEDTRIYQYLTSTCDSNPVKLLTSYNNCVDCNQNIKNGIVKAIEDIMLDLLAAYDRTNHERNAETKFAAQKKYLAKIYHSCNVKGKGDVFVSWKNRFGVKDTNEDCMKTESASEDKKTESTPEDK